MLLCPALPGGDVLPPWPEYNAGIWNHSLGHSLYLYPIPDLLPSVWKERRTRTQRWEAPPFLRSRVYDLQKSLLILAVIALLLWTFGSLVVWNRWSNTGPSAIHWNVYRFVCLFADSSLACSEVVRLDWNFTLFVDKQNDQVFTEKNNCWNSCLLSLMEDYVTSYFPDSR